MSDFMYGVVFLILALLGAVDLIKRYQKKGKLEFTWANVGMISGAIICFIGGVYFLFT